MGWHAAVVADSVSPEGVRLTTMALKYPRFIHAEFMTHRMFSRNASGSRAIPVAKLIEDIRNDPVEPLHWGKNQKGMQAHEELDEDTRLLAKAMWHTARFEAIEQAEMMAKVGVHKQVVNRILEPFSWIHVIVTATEWSNFFALRDHPDAQPEIQHLARLMKQAMAGSVPKDVYYGNWHLPYIVPEDVSYFEASSDGGICLPNGTFYKTDEALRLISSGRCARVSYWNHEGKRDIVADIVLAERLLESGHMSPFEHQAYAAFRPGQWPGNFRGWVQFRKILPCEADFGARFLSNSSTPSAEA